MSGEHSCHVSSGKGPYLSPDYDELYLPTEHYTFNQARTEAASFCGELGDEWMRTRYVGKRTVQMHDHEDWEECEPGTCCEREGWHFELYQGTYRA